MTNPKRQNYLKKLAKIIEVSKSELADDFFNPEEKQLQELIVSQQERLLEKMQKNG